MSSILTFFSVYLIIGTLFGIAFVIKGCKVVEPAATDSGVRFRLLILPASIALWPLLAHKWRSKGKAL